MLFPPALQSVLFRVTRTLALIIGLGYVELVSHGALYAPAIHSTLCREKAGVAIDVKMSLARRIEYVTQGHPHLPIFAEYF